MNLTVDVLSDVICPWCYIGKRRLEKAIADLHDPHRVQVHWHPFQLNPTMPPEGISRREYRTQKFGTWERSLQLDAQVIAAGQAAGIRFVFDENTRTPNTVDAHRLIGLAAQHGCQDAVVEALFRAYFTDGSDIGNRQTLLDVSEKAGLNRRDAELMLDRDDEMNVISNGREMSQRHGVTAVPFFIINNAIALSGAQAPETFLDVFKQSKT